MTQAIPRSFLDRIPKTDLHLHLDGSLRVSTLIELAKSSGVALPSETEEGLFELVFKEKYKDLPDYLQGFGLTCAVLQTPENLERAAYELAATTSPRTSATSRSATPRNSTSAPASAWRT